jgi:hypothetical protein
MENTPKLPESSFEQEQGKNTPKHSQLQTIFQYLQTHTATASMVANATNIYQKNICRYKADLSKKNLIWELEKKPCEITGFKAHYLTTDPSKAPKASIQLDLFERKGGLND